ncbi:MAG: hypothetical protein AAGG50_07915 [Bacteroidota bacterium]
MRDLQDSFQASVFAEPADADMRGERGEADIVEDRPDDGRVAAVEAAEPPWSVA